MKILETVGIDVSKLTLDVKIYSTKDYLQVENSEKGFRKMIRWVFKNTSFKAEETLFMFEDTGLYSHNLGMFLQKEGITFNVVSGLQLKKSLGITRGKSDKVDAWKIADYAYEKKDKITPSVMPAEEVMQLKNLLALRERLVKHKAGYTASYKEYKRTFVQKENKVLFSVQEKTIKYLEKQIESVEKELMVIIKSNYRLKEVYDLATSVKSVGMQTALHMIVYTFAFTKFSNYRKFATYCGVAPFPNTSGTSIKGKDKISHFANKKMKTLLSNCARNAITYNSEMKLFYKRKVTQGKAEKCVENIIRNKLIARVFAAVQRGTPYINTMKFAT